MKFSYEENVDEVDGEPADEEDDEHGHQDAGASAVTQPLRLPTKYRIYHILFIIFYSKFSVPENS